MYREKMRAMRPCAPRVTPAYAPALWSLSLIATTMYQTTQFGCDIICRWLLNYLSDFGLSN